MTSRLILHCNLQTIIKTRTLMRFAHCAIKNETINNKKSPWTLSRPQNVVLQTCRELAFCCRSSQKIHNRANGYFFFVAHVPV